MRLLRPASEDDMVAIFLAAEVSSERFGPQIAEILAALGQPPSVAAHPDTRDAAANAVRRQVLAAYRGYPSGDVFTGMPADVTWQHAALTPDELASCSASPPATASKPHDRDSHLHTGRRHQPFGDHQD